MTPSLFAYKNGRVCGIYFGATGKAMEHVYRLHEDAQLSCQGCGKYIEKGYGKVYCFSELIFHRGKILVHVLCDVCTQPVLHAISRVTNAKQTRPEEESAASVGSGFNA